MTAYRHVETYLDPQVGQPIYYGQIEIRQSKDSVITVVLNVNVSTPDSRRIVETILDDVAA